MCDLPPYDDASRAAAGFRIQNIPLCSPVSYCIPEGLKKGRAASNSSILDTHIHVCCSIPSAIALGLIVARTKSMIDSPIETGGDAQEEGADESSRNLSSWTP